MKNKMNIRHQSLKLLLAIVSILSYLDWGKVSIATPLPSTINYNSLKTIEGDRVIFSSPEPKQSRGTPTGTTSPNRGCKSKDLVALVPLNATDSKSTLSWGLTTKERPTFWLYITDSPNSILSGKFSLWRWDANNKDETTVYESQLAFTNTPGIISVTLPATTEPLQIDQWYHFYFFIDVECPQNGVPETISAEGWIRREEPNTDLKTQLQSATLLQQAILYGKNGFWYDMLKALAELKQTEPKNQQWAEVLRSTGLEKVASEPIVDCCKPEN